MCNVYGSTTRNRSSVARKIDQAMNMNKIVPTGLVRWLYRADRVSELAISYLVCAFPAKMLKCHTLNKYPRFPAPANAPAKFLEESFSKITREFSVHARASARSAMYLARRINWFASHQCVQCSDLELHFGICSPAANTSIVVILSLVYANRCKVLKF